MILGTTSLSFRSTLVKSPPRSPAVTVLVWVRVVSGVGPKVPERGASVGPLFSLR